MKIRIEDAFYDFDAERLMLSEALAVKTYTGMSIPEWQKALEQFDPSAVQALAWLLKKRNGEDVRFSDVDFNLAEFEVIADEGEAADPTSGVTTPAESGSESSSTPE